MIAGIFFMSSMDAVAKFLVQADYSVPQMLAIRGAVLIPLLIVWMMMRGGPGILRTRQIGTHGIRVVFGVLAPLLFFLSLKELPLAGFIGVLIVMQPTSGVLKMDALMVIGASLCYSGVMLTGRVLSQTETTFTIIFYSNLGVLIATACLAVFFWHPIPLQDVALVALMALLSLAGNICLVKSFALGEVGVITPFEYTGIFWAVMLGYLIFGDFPGLHVWLGVVIIAGSGLYMIYRENRKRA